MTSMQATIWFKGEPVARNLCDAFSLAAEPLGFKAHLMCDGQQLENSPENWEMLIRRFPDYEFSGEVTWLLVRDSGQLKGKVTWPILNPGGLPGTIEFNFNVGTPDKNKKNSFVFESVRSVIGLLHPLCVGASAVCVLVEPRRLPPEIAEHRYQQFKRLHGKKSLTCIDWIFGLRTDDSQFKGLWSSRERFVETENSDGFVIVALAPKPQDYSSDSIMNLLK